MSLNFNAGYGYSNIMPNAYTNQQGNCGSYWSSLKGEYGCEDCFRKQPYPYEYPKPMLQLPRDVVKPTLMSRLSHLFFGG